MSRDQSMTDIRPDWVRRAALGGVLVSSAVLSYAVLRQRAEHTGFHDWTVWFYPICLDATILGALRTWRDASLSARTRQAGLTVALGAVGAGAAGFVAEFAAKGPAAVVFALVVPLALAASLLLTSFSAADQRRRAGALEEVADADALLKTARQTRADAEQELATAREDRLAAEREAELAKAANRRLAEAAPAQSPTAAPARTPAPAASGSPTLSDDELVRRARQLLAVDATLGQPRLAKELGVTRHQIRRLQTRIYGPSRLAAVAGD